MKNKYLVSDDMFYVIEQMIFRVFLFANKFEIFESEAYKNPKMLKEWLKERL